MATMVETKEKKPAARAVVAPVDTRSARDRLAALNAGREKARAAVRRAPYVADEAPKREGKQSPTLKAVWPNAGIEANYRKRLDSLIAEMSNSVQYWLAVAYKRNEPRIAQDAAPADVLKRVVKELADRWQTKFDDLAPWLADYFAGSVQDRTDAAMKKSLKDAGWTVPMRMTPAQKDVLKATINQNVALIKSIPQRYFTEVEGAVMRSVQTGRDLGQLTKDLQQQYGVTRRRAAHIALDQNNKATSAMNHARMNEIGVTEAVWIHSHAGKEPRPTHVKMDGQKYDITKGMFDPAVGEHILPGQLINCRCVSRAMIPGFT